MLSKHPFSHARTAVLVVGFAVTAMVLSLLPTQAAGADTNSTGPSNVRGFVGGVDIALIWNASPSAYCFIVFPYRTKVGSSAPTGSSSYKNDGTRFTDVSVVPGTTYSYQVTWIDSRNRESRKSTAAVLTQPSVTTPPPNVTFDTSAAPDLAGYMANGPAQTLRTWYPKVAYKIARPDYTDPRDLTVTVKDIDGIAYADGTNIVIDTDWVRQHPDDLGVYVHESTHSMQQYTGFTTGLVIEGTADWARYTLYNDADLTLPGATASYNDGYGTSAYFMQWIATTYNQPNLVHNLNVAAHNGTYSEALFKQYTGRSIGQLWTTMTGHRITSSGPFLNTASGKCVDLLNYNTNNGTPLQINPCVGNIAQQFVFTSTSGTSATGTFRVMGKCMDTAGFGTSIGTAVQVFDCNGGTSQNWTTKSNGTLVNAKSGLCLQAKALLTAPETKLEIAKCTTASQQRWTLPPA